MDKVVHFEIPVDDAKRAQDFYSRAFGWQMNSIPSMGYTIIRTVEVDENQMPKEPGAINGGMMKRSSEVKSPVITVNVENVDDALKKIKELGGSVVMEKMKVGDMGFAAYFKDTEGNVLGLWQNAK